MFRYVTVAREIEDAQFTHIGFSSYSSVKPPFHLAAAVLESNPTLPGSSKNGAYRKLSTLLAMSLPRSIGAMQLLER